MAWLSSLPETMDRRTGVQEAVRAWLRRDREAVWAWFEGREAAAWLDEGFSLYALSWARHHPDRAAEALEVALRIEKETLRWATVVRIWRPWLSSDQQAAGEWFAARYDEIPDFYREKMRVSR